MNNEDGIEDLDEEAFSQAAGGRARDVVDGNGGLANRSGAASLPRDGWGDGSPNNSNI
jgi:hypothetical protein